MMPDVDSFDKEQHVLGDIRGMIRNAFQVTYYADEIHGLADVLGIALHEASEFVVTGVTQAVDSVVGSKYAAREFRIAIDECIQTLAHHGTNQRPNVRNVDHRLDNRRLHQRRGTLRDIHRKVADAFQVGVDLQCRDNQTQVGSHRLLSGKQVYRKCIDLNLDLVDAALVFVNFLGRVLVLVHHGGNAAHHGQLHQGA